MLWSDCIFWKVLQSFLLFMIIYLYWFGFFTKRVFFQFCFKQKENNTNDLHGVHVRVIQSNKMWQCFASLYEGNTHSCGCGSESCSVGEAETDGDRNTEGIKMAVYYFTFLTGKNNVVGRTRLGDIWHLNRRKVELYKSLFQLLIHTHLIKDTIQTELLAVLCWHYWKLSKPLCGSRGCRE